jgi:hypothetical protein
MSRLTIRAGERRTVRQLDRLEAELLGAFIVNRSNLLRSSDEQVLNRFRLLSHRIARAIEDRTDGSHKVEIEEG